LLGVCLMNVRALLTQCSLAHGKTQEWAVLELSKP
jgi:hypothetical protein